MSRRLSVKLALRQSSAALEWQPDYRKCRCLLEVFGYSRFARRLLFVRRLKHSRRRLAELETAVAFDSTAVEVVLSFVGHQTLAVVHTSRLGISPGLSRTRREGFWCPLQECEPTKACSLK